MDLSKILTESKEFVQAFVGFLASAVAVLVGAFFIYSAFKKMVDHAHGLRHGQPTAGPIMINLFIGAIMVQFSFMMDRLVFTIFGETRESPSQAMNYMPAPVQKSGTMLNMLIHASVWWIAAIGVVAIFRGFILWNDLAKGNNGQNSLGWKGFWHVFFGAACVNFPGVLKLFSGQGSVMPDP